MNRWRALTPFPRIMLCIQAGLLVLFTILYPLGMQRGIDFQGGVPPPGGTGRGIRSIPARWTEKQWSSPIHPSRRPLYRREM